MIVPEVLGTPHAFVRKSKGRLFRAGLKSKAVRLERSCLDVTVSRAHLDRALRIMDALLKALEARGHKVFMTEPRTLPGYRGDTRQPSETGVHVGNVAVEFGIEEVIDSIRRGEPRPKGDDVKAWFEWRHRNPPPWYIYRPSGRLLPGHPFVELRPEEELARREEAEARGPAERVHREHPQNRGAARH